MARPYESIVHLYPGMLAKRAQGFLDVKNPLDLYGELALARAALSAECERYGVAHEAYLEADGDAKDPDVRGVLAAIQTVDRVVGRIREIQFIDSIPVEQIREVIESMRRTIHVHLADSPDVIEQIESAWNALPIGDGGV